MEYFEEFCGKLKAYQGEAKAQETLSEALYIISLGTNDFLENYYTVPGGRRSQYTVEEYQDFLIGIAEGFIREIYQFGARKVDVAGILPMGCLPLERATSSMMMGACNEMYNKVAWNFNSKLQCSIKRLNRELHGITIVYGDVYRLFLDVVQNPSSYGEFNQNPSHTFPRQRMTFNDTSPHKGQDCWHLSSHIIWTAIRLQR